MSEVKRYIVHCATCTDATPIESVGPCWMIMESDYAALEAELAKLEAGMPRLMQANYDLRQERDAALAECERLRGFLIRASRAKSAAELMLIFDAALSAKPNNDGVVEQ